MERKTNWYAVLLIWEAVKIMALNAWDSMMEAFKDTLKGMYKHPILTMIIISMLIYSFVSMAEARAQRDHSAQVQLKLQTQIEQMSL